MLGSNWHTSLVLLASLFSACSLIKPFQPPPDPEELWRKDGYDLSEVRAKLKQCGWIVPRKNFETYGRINWDIYAQSELCMKESGFSYVGRSPLVCETEEGVSLPACISYTKKKSALR